MPRQPSRCVALGLTAVIGLGLLAVGQRALARQDGEPVRDEERVTAVDVLVELVNSRSLQPIPPPRDLSAADLTVLRDGEPAPLVGLELPSSPSAEPWQLVIYFDLPLASSRTVRWASSLLAEHLVELLALGPIEIVIADPEPGRRLAMSSDLELIDNTLSGIFLSVEGEDRLVRRRERFLIERAEGPGSAAPPTPAADAVADEQRLIRDSQDELATWLLDHAGNTPRQALLLVSDGFDLDPWRFYNEASDADEGTPRPGDAAPVPAGTETLARTLAAYGWTVIPLAAPEAVRGAARFGIQWARPIRPIPTVSLRSIAVWLDRNRSPKKADAYNELGLSLRAQGELEKAEEAFRRAVYRYYDHPKTADRQAAALVNLGETLELQGKTLEARDAYRSAVAFDADLADAYPFTAARLADPLAPLALLAEATAGRVVREPESFDELLAALDNRVRVTYQVAGPPDGSLHELEVRSNRTAGVVAPGWSRSGTPPAVGALKLRRLLGGRLEAGELPTRVFCGALAEATGSGDSSVSLRVEFPPLTDRESSAANPIRLTWGSWGPQTEMIVRNRLLSPGTLARGALDQRIELPPGHVWAAALIEDIATGAWGGGLCELD